MYFIKKHYYNIKCIIILMNYIYFLDFVIYKVKNNKPKKLRKL